MQRCELCPNKHNCVPPSGPEDADLLFIGEAPGKDEDRKMEVFTGKTGLEVSNHYMPLAGFRRSTVRICNSISCLPDRPHNKLDIQRQADLDLLYSCASTNLYPELSSPHKLIIPMGTFACHAIDPDINLELQHGIPLETAYGTAFPMYHPAQGLYEPKKMLMLRNDWVRLGKYLKNKLVKVEDEYPNPSYRVATASMVVGDCRDYADGVPLACDTEVTRLKEPFCLTYSTWAGSGRLIRAEDTDTLYAFQNAVNHWTGPILWHNWLFDYEVTQAMGLRFPRHLIVDTMVRAFHLGNLPQGLKALCYRLLGMKMQDFDDLVTPYSTPLCVQYMRAIYDHDWPKPDEELVRDDEGHWKLYKPQGIGPKAKRFLTDYAKNPSMDIYERWDRWEPHHAQIEAVMGPWPGKDIRYVPFDKALHYACRDADGLLRLWPVLEAMTRNVRKKNQEDWGDINVTTL